jgi:hypothetical protein
MYIRIYVRMHVCPHAVDRQHREINEIWVWLDSARCVLARHESTGDMSDFRRHIAQIFHPSQSESFPRSGAVK